MLRPTRRGYLLLLLSFAVFLLVPLWALFGVFVQEAHVHAHDGHMGEAQDPRQEFKAKAQAFIEANKREDGCVEPKAEGDGENPVIYIMAMQFMYMPGRLCLQPGVTYELRIMSMDVTHGASIQLGSGSRMIRLPPGVEVVMEVTFTKPGDYLIYCTFYCGLGHQFMSGHICVGPCAA